LGFKQKRIASPLVGLRVYRSDGNLFGDVIDVLDFGAGEVVEIKKPGGKIEMFPNNEQFLKLSGDKTRVILQPFDFVEATPE
jgi:ribosomal 30S subunit maturation factor RimM